MWCRRERERVELDSGTCEGGTGRVRSHFVVNQSVYGDQRVLRTSSVIACGSQLLPQQEAVARETVGGVMGMEEEEGTNGG